MNLLLLYNKHDHYPREIVEYALKRSFIGSMVSSCTYEEMGSTPDCIVLLKPEAKHYSLLKQLTRDGRKVMVLGYLPHDIALFMGINVEPLSPRCSEWGSISVTEQSPCDVSYASIHYHKDNVLGAASPLNTRHFARYDFTDEWNNMGYGRITLDQQAWSLAMVAQKNGAMAIADVVGPDGEHLSLYSSVTDLNDSSVLWFNRPVGPVDSLEWTVVEKFFSEYRSDSLSCLPSISEIPFGYTSAATMTLDCDQDVGSARHLFELYRDRQLPLSMAILTGLGFKKRDTALMQDTLSSGGALVMHSHTHMPDWGGSYEAAMADIGQAKAWMESHFNSVRPVFAVSPFHQNPPYAVQAMADAGILGFIGGIIHNDPEYLLGRAGRVPFVNGTVVSHSRQCMLHGDCYHRYGNSVDPYKQSFDHHRAARAIFGYLDHPFSSQYQYGWLSEDERAAAHNSLLEYISSHDGLWWCNASECLSFLLKRDRTEVRIERGGFAAVSPPVDGLPDIAIEYRGIVYKEGVLVG